MSLRTSEANKAITEAWKKEQILVAQGKGTRNWNTQQQEDILTKGRAYDEDGKAFEGHHMKSAEAFPQYQRDPNNVQFLTRAEHQDAHHGNFRNKTNGYYNPATGKTNEFKQDEVIQCKAKRLSESLRIDNRYSNHANKDETSKLTDTQRDARNKNVLDKLNGEKKEHQKTFSDRNKNQSEVKRNRSQQIER